MQTKNCQNCKNDYKIEQEDIEFYEKFSVCIPDLCPLCRAQLRLSFRNERVFYKRPCDKCGEGMISMYSPNNKHTVYCYDCWFADDWDALQYGRAYNPSKTFFEQFKTLSEQVPKIGLIYVRSPGSEYINISADNKNCYMIVESSNNEDSIHSYWIQECNDVVDTSFSSKCELTYECDDCYNCYELFYSKGAHDCRQSYFLYDCVGCTDCIGCVNLRQAQYCIFNKKYSKEEYEKLKKEMALDTVDGVKKIREVFDKFLKSQPRKFAEQTMVTKSTGNYMKNTKNCVSCFHCYDAEDNRYGVHIWREAKDTMDCDTAGRNANMIYNSINSGLDTAYQISCAVCWSSTFTEYCMYCFNSNNCFGCVGLRKKEYCVLNKQYTKEEYEKIKKQIVDELEGDNIYGNFFPQNISHFGYNETPAFEQFPLVKDEALSQGYAWEDFERGTYGKEDGKEIFACLECQKNYRIIPNEFSFYEKLKIPIPTLCPDCRHNRRFKNRGPNKLWHRACMCDIASHGHENKCSNEFETSYAPDRPEIIYCESCYNREVI